MQNTLLCIKVVLDLIKRNVWLSRRLRLLISDNLGSIPIPFHSKTITIVKYKFVYPYYLLILSVILFILRFSRRQQSQNKMQQER